MNFDEFHFLRPEWFWILPVLVVVALIWLRQSLNKGSWGKVCDIQLLPYIIEEKPERNSRLPWVLFVTAALLSVIALAGPTWKHLPLPVYRNQSALVIVLDLSRSMDAEDTKPSRLIRARYKIADILEQRRDGSTALVVYSNEAYTVTPLTDDRATISSQLSALETSIMPAQGSDIATGLNRAIELLKQSGNPGGNILLITDRADSGALKVAKALKQQGYRLYVLGVGSDEGAPIPAAGGGFVKNDEGNIVVSKLKAEGLDLLAQTGGGFYRRLTVDDHDIDSFLASFDRLTEMPQGGQSTLRADQWVEEGPWLLVFILPIAAFAFRRGYLVVLLSLVLPFPGTAYAWQWNDLWRSQDQQAYRAFQQGDHAQAADLFEDPAWKAASEYSAGQYQKAIDTLNEIDSKNTAYNEGNALARAGQFSESLKAFSRALELDPDNEDARYNKDLIEKMMEQQEKSKNESSDRSDSSEDDRNTAQNQENAEQQGSRNRNNDQQQEQTDSTDTAKEQDRSENRASSNPSNSDQRSQNENNHDKKEASVEQQMQPEEIPPSRNDPSLADTKDRLDQQQADEQWLRRIPDDPAGLLRRKFKYQYKKRNPRQVSKGGLW